jgi:hypothetical protein
VEGYDATKSRDENIKNITKIAIDKALEEIKSGQLTPTPIPKPIVPPNNDKLDLFKTFIINSWKTDYKEGNVTFYKEGNYYVAEDKSVNTRYLYKYNNNTFELVP